MSYSPRDKRLINQWAPDHTTTIAGGRPILALDMYVHAYHMDYGAKAAAYVDAYMDVIRWENAAKLLPSANSVPKSTLGDVLGISIQSAACVAWRVRWSATNGSLSSRQTVVR